MKVTAAETVEKLVILKAASMVNQFRQLVLINVSVRRDCSKVCFVIQQRSEVTIWSFKIR